MCGLERVPFCGGLQTACQSCGGGGALATAAAGSALSLVALPLPLAADAAGRSSSESEASSTVAAGGLEAALVGAAEVKGEGAAAAAAAAAAGGEAAELADADEVVLDASPSAAVGEVGSDMLLCPARLEAGQREKRVGGQGGRQARDR